MRLELASGADSIAGALHLPETSRLPSPGIIVIPDVFGLSDLYERIAQRLAGAGFAALALDLYSRGERPGTLDDMPGVMRFMRRLPDRRVLADISAAIAWLGARPEVAGRKLGLTGFCMGGKYAFLAAANCAGLSAVVAWYGMLRADEIDAENPEHALDALARLSTPLLALFGADDVLIPQTDVERLRALASERALPIETVVYPGAGHAFANDARPASYRPDAAADAWKRALEFFARELGS